MAGRYIPSGKAKVVFAPAVANIAAPSGAEITAGTVLTVAGSTAAAGLKEMKGWETQASNADVPDVSSTFDKTIPGRTKAAEPSCTFYDDDSSTTIRTALAEGTSGYMIIMRYGQVTAKRCEVWPCRVTALNDSPVDSENKASMFEAVFAVTEAPNKVAVVP